MQALVCQLKHTEHAKLLRDSLEKSEAFAIEGANWIHQTQLHPSKEHVLSSVTGHSDTGEGYWLLKQQEQQSIQKLVIIFLLQKKLMPNLGCLSGDSEERIAYVKHQITVSNRTNDS